MKPQDFVRLTCLGSSSHGNGYVLDDGEHTLILELGMDIGDYLGAIHHRPSRCVGALISHEHGDHAKARTIKEIQKYRIPLLMSHGTANALGVTEYHSNITELGRWIVTPFKIKHDANEPWGFYITHPLAGALVFATDTYYLPYHFTEVQHYLIECNYKAEYLFESETMHPMHRDRVLRSHMSLETCRDFLRASDMQSARNIVLLHLSGDNSDPSEFRREIQRASGGVSTYVATKGLTLDLYAGDTPF